MTVPDLITTLRDEQVPFSTDPCRYCPDPCDEDHEAYPSRLSVDQDTPLIGTVKPYGKQCVISTGKTDWEREVTEVKGSLAAELARAHDALKKPDAKRRKSISVQIPSNHTRSPPSPSIPGVFNSEESSRLSILNGSHVSNDPDSGAESVLVFPDFKVVNVQPNASGAVSFWEEHINPTRALETIQIGAETPATKSWILPYACVILLCSHKRRDNRCAITAPKLEYALRTVLECEGWEVHTQLEHVCLLGPPLQPEDDVEAERDKVLKESERRALILKTSHIGGHKYAGNVMIYTPSRAGIWYGRVTTHNVEPIVRKTIIEGKVLPELLRGGVNLTCKRGKTLLAW